MADFVQTVRREGRAHWRDLPWRNVDDPYAVLVSEVMLQQTQVKRVLDYWPRWLALFPTLDALAVADTSLVLELWQGLGYNRRALALKRCAQICSDELDGQLPVDEKALRALPGIGPATAAGVRAFAHNLPGVYLETNVRTVFLHELFPSSQDVSDKDLVPLVRDTCPPDDARAWYYALLDYGAHLKATLPNPSRRSKHHSRQSKFEGSRRQKRAELLRIVLGGGHVTLAEASRLLDAEEKRQGRPAVDPELVRSLLAQMGDEGFFAFDPETGECRVL